MDTMETNTTPTKTTGTPASIYVIDHADDTRHVAMAIGSRDEIQVAFDGICFADIRLTSQDDPITAALAIHADQIPALIARLTEIYGEHRVYRASRATSALIAPEVAR